MNSTEVKNTSQLQVDCVDEGCLNAHIVVAGAKNVGLNCTGENGCNGLNLQASYVGQTANIACNGFQSCNSAAFRITGNNLLEAIVQVESTYPMRESLWNFEYLERVTFNCFVVLFMLPFLFVTWIIGLVFDKLVFFFFFNKKIQKMKGLAGGSCYNMTVNGYFVEDMQLICNGATGLACEYGILNMTAFSNTTLTCTQNGCAQGRVYCPEPLPSMSSCNVNCLLGSGPTSSYASCKDIDIYTSSNYAYGNSVNLTCQIIDQVESCDSVTIHCGERYSCNCPVTLEEDQSLILFLIVIIVVCNASFHQIKYIFPECLSAHVLFCFLSDTWYCDGQCGTEECVESSSSSSSTDAGVIAVAVIIPLLVIILLIAGGCWWSRRRKQEEVSLLKPKEESLNTESKGRYETYQ
ncbi:hypothetical protein RFI_04361 [Reticulomyxa filosa]|uniref:Uncharacterized protein n=1 Tax=Reticulomyxa filosa TaxID=46433 RepID=X6P590_RETFI|nr:hypothetical protein RFI_04361 [Reticulomyxa filosa]|eukprot:ETO32757.1 hypothetical protein RFI_04361 [Reticulomyxa filosa]